MTIKDIQEMLNKPYNRVEWQKLMESIFPNVEFYSKVEEHKLNGKNGIDLIRVLGYFRSSDQKILNLYEVKVVESKNIYRSRVGLREALAAVIDFEKNNGFLAVFEQDKEDFRFTFASKETQIIHHTSQLVTSETDKRRFTYMLGSNQKCWTAAKQLFEIQNKKQALNLKDIIDAFNLGALNDDFFKEYRKCYGSFISKITGKDENQKGSGELMPNFEKYFRGTDELARKTARDFVKKMMGRIVFLYFVQKKGWLGVPKGKNWGVADFGFMKNLFDATKDKNRFYRDVLETLFYKNLNAARPDDIFDINKNLFNDSFAENIRIPYLNGGLFNDDMPSTNGFQFPNEEILFTEFFEFLDKYNFTIDENSDQEQTVAIDPEMLGRVFENLLEDNKEKGAFYTPREIVHYMCRQSLAEYLTTALETKHGIQDPQLREKMENFVVNDDASEVRDWVQPLASALREVKVCDPAIGSGAFPMGMLREILEALNTLASVEEQTVREVWSIQGEYSDNYARIKEQIIQNSIYGVDIEKGAVDIARLRFWLSLIVDENEPKPLPNLDYKIVVGNSLISMLNGVPLDINWELNAFAGGQKLKERIIESIKTLNQLQRDYFSTGVNVPGLALEIRNAKIQLLIDQVRLNMETHIHNNATQLKIGLDLTTKEINQLKEYENQIESFHNLIEYLNELYNSRDKDLEYFNWKLNFSEIFSSSMSDKSGFDIVIGNPPYLGEKKNKISFLPVQKSSLGKYYLGRMDYFYFFFHLSLDIMKEKGVSTFITTNYYPTALGGKKLRTELKNKSTLIEIVNFNETKIFDSAAGQHNMITTYSRALKDIKCRVKTSNKIGSITATELSVFLNGNYPYSIVNYILNSELWDGPENYLRFLGINAKSSNINIVLEKIISKSTALLGDLCTPLIGLKSSLDSVFVLDRNKVDEVTKLNKKDESLFKPFFKNSDIKKYHIKSNTNKYILYLHEKINDIESYDGVWSYLLKNEKSIKDRKDANLKGAYKSGNWWVLSTPRLDMNFNEEKIVTPYRSKLPCFAFAAKEWYASNDVYYIINKKGTVGLKYVLGLLNSKLYYVWHYNRGKRKGNTLEMYAKPLKEIPIYEAPVEVQTKYFILVDEIIKLKKIDPDIDTNHLETQIDILTYRLYDLTYDEVKSIDKEFILSLEEYNAFIL